MVLTYLPLLQDTQILLHHHHQGLFFFPQKNPKLGFAQFPNPINHLQIPILKNPLTNTNTNTNTSTNFPHPVPLLYLSKSAVRPIKPPPQSPPSISPFPPGTSPLPPPSLNSDDLLSLSNPTHLLLLLLLSSIQTQMKLTVSHLIQFRNNQNAKPPPIRRNS